MPINRVPVVHKFGIISYSQRLELQERLLKLSFPDSTSKKATLQSNRKPLEISEDFIQQFNNAPNLDEKEKYEDLAYKILERIKRRCGLRNGSEGQHVNLPLAWTELAQLAQCKGKAQEDCLDVLIISLDQAPMEHHHIPALFFLAETMLYWLRTDVIHQPYLRTSELKLLKMGQFVFTRLFYHHMIGDLHQEQHFKARLFTYLDGLRECQDAYSPYPNALLSLRFIIEVGKIILSDLQMGSDTPEGGLSSREKSQISSTLGRLTPKSVPPPEHASPRIDGQTDPISPKIDHKSPRPTILTDHAAQPSMQSASQSTKKISSGEITESSASTHSGELSSSMHNLSPSLWHSLDVWRCTNHLSGGLNQALISLAYCAAGLANESWVDSICSLMILSEAAKTQLSVLRTMQGLAVGRVPQEHPMSPPVTQSSCDTNACTVSMDDLKDEAPSEVSSKPSLSDIFERSEEGENSSKLKSSGSSTIFDEKSSPSEKSSVKGDNANSPDKNVQMTPTETVASDGKSVLRNPSSSRLNTNREVSFDESLPSNTGTKKNGIAGLKAETQGDNPTLDPQDTGHLAEVGSVTHTGRGSRASSVPTFTNQAVPDDLGINGWHWETAVVYTELMANICLHGNSSKIQKMALMGNNSDLASIFQRAKCKQPLQSASLLDLVKFTAPSEKNDGGSNDWSWRVRFGAIQSLVKICRYLSNDKTKEGLRNIAWAALMHAHSAEKDDRVLEALKVGEVFSSLEKLCKKQTTALSCVLGGRIASGLAQTYLPQLPPVVPPPDNRSKQRRRRGPSGPPDIPFMSEKPLRTTIRDEIDLTSVQVPKQPSFNTRTSFDLRRIVEDQWRKELQELMEEEESNRQETLENNQVIEEQRQQKLSENKKNKFKKTVTS